mmetsp:Transcript_19773/g.40992  ORF Transcript_19773/g.40992 Transcript_19773/m.40992 type:complete len:285 (-) Transcript_19773:211-1065(-)
MIITPFQIHLPFPRLLNRPCLPLIPKRLLVHMSCIQIPMPRSHADQLCDDPIPPSLIIPFTTIILAKPPPIIPPQPRPENHSQMFRQHHRSMSSILASNRYGHVQWGNGTVSSFVDGLDYGSNDLVGHFVGASPHWTWFLVLFAVVVTRWDVVVGIIAIVLTITTIITIIMNITVTDIGADTAPPTGIQKRPLHPVRQSVKFGDIGRSFLQIPHVPRGERMGVIEALVAFGRCSVFVSEGEDFDADGGLVCRGEHAFVVFVVVCVVVVVVVVLWCGVEWRMADC